MIEPSGVAPFGAAPIFFPQEKWAMDEDAKKTLVAHQALYGALVESETEQLVVGAVEQHDEHVNARFRWRATKRQAAE